MKLFQIKSAIWEGLNMFKINCQCAASKITGEEKLTRCDQYLSQTKEKLALTYLGYSDYEAVRMMLIANSIEEYLSKNIPIEEISNITHYTVDEINKTIFAMKQYKAFTILNPDWMNMNNNDYIMPTAEQVEILSRTTQQQQPATDATKIKPFVTNAAN